MAFRLYVRRGRGTEGNPSHPGQFVEIHSAVSLAPAFDAKIGEALVDESNLSVIAVDTAGATLAARYLLLRVT